MRAGGPVACRCVTGTRLDGYVDDERERITGALLDWLAIPSISARADNADEVRRSAEWLVAAVREAGANEAEVLETDGHPAVFAEWSGAGPAAPTVLVYGHHDVQPVDPEHEWRHPPFEPVIVDLGDPGSREAFLKISPFGKMPALEDTDRGETVIETSVIIDYLDLHHPGALRLVPEDADAAWRARLLDRVFDLYVNEPMAKIVTDKLRPEGSHDPFGVDAARVQLRSAYGWLEPQLRGRTWAMGERAFEAEATESIRGRNVESIVRALRRGPIPSHLRRRHLAPVLLQQSPAAELDRWEETLDLVPNVKPTKKSSKSTSARR